MENEFRITRKIKGENAIALNNTNYSLRKQNDEYGTPIWECLKGDVADRLGAYEDTGLTPKEVIRLKELLKESANALTETSRRIAKTDMLLADCCGCVYQFACEDGEKENCEWNWTYAEEVEHLLKKELPV